jgi:hypothetical protein
MHAKAVMPRDVSPQASDTGHHKANSRSFTQCQELCEISGSHGGEYEDSLVGYKGREFSE